MKTLYNAVTILDRRCSGADGARFHLFLHITYRIVLTQNNHLYTLPKEKRTKDDKDLVQNKDKVQCKNKYQHVTLFTDFVTNA